MAEPEAPQKTDEREASPKGEVEATAPKSDPAPKPSPKDAPDSEPEVEKKAGEASPKGDEKPESPLAFLKGGNPMRLRRGGIAFGVGAFVSFLLMARDQQWRWSVPVGFVFILIAVVGALDIIGSFDDKPSDKEGPPDKDAHLPEYRSAPPPARVAAEVKDAKAALVPGLATLFTLLTTMSLMSYAGTWVWGLFIAAGWIATCALGYKTLAAVGLVDDVERPLLHRHGFWLIVFCCVLYLPTLGAHGLVDPWETHYGEVSREVLARDDWITIWWAEEGFFTSKPILDFWMQALAMAVFGVKYLPGQMIAPGQIGGEPVRPEWIVRLPSLTLSVIALYLAYRAVAQVRGRRAGLIGAIILATMGDWMMLSHQSITDMPFVASLTAAMSLLIIGLTTDEDKTVLARPIRFGSRTWTVSGYHLALAVVLVCAIPQAIYLLSRNFELVTHGSFGFAPHMDEYRSGSGHECWMAPSTGDAFERLMRIGKWPCDLGKVVHPEFQPALQGLVWLAALGFLLMLNRNERRISRLCFIVAWVFAGISTMGKGVAGFLLPIAVAGCYVFIARKWRDLVRLELLSGVLVLATVAAPWYVAMYMRMGDEFIQQLFVHHMWKRALDHVHDTNTGDDVSLRYYVWQLGYAMFPWTGLVPAGLVWWARQRWGQIHRALTIDEERQRDVSLFLVMWFIFAWALFTYMKTKFHHYVFPAVPPAALLTGIFLDEAIGKKPLADRARTAAWLAVTLVGVAIAAYGFSRLVPGWFFGYWDAAHPKAASPKIGAALALVGLVLAFAAQRLARDTSDDVDDDEDSKSSTFARNIMVGGIALAGAITTGLVTRDLASRPDTDIKGQERLIQLFTYRYDRLWPKELNFTPALLGFGLAATVLTFALVARAWRRQAIISLCAVAALFSAWTLDVYMVKIAPHWGQRPLFEAYYRDRRSLNEPIVAFEMNWKGENFYSGGRLIEFGNGMGQGATSGERGSERMRTWLTDMRTKTKAIYFVTEFGRVSKIDDMLRGVLGSPPNGTRWTEQITTEAQDNKFVVVRARFN